MRGGGGLVASGVTEDWYDIQIRCARVCMTSIDPAVRIKCAPAVLVTGSNISIRILNGSNLTKDDFLSTEGQ